MKIKITAPGSEPREYDFTALEQSGTSAMFALQRVTGKVMPKELQRLRDEEDVLTLTYYTAWMILWRAGDKTDLDALYEYEIEMVPEPGDVATEAEAEAEEADPTPAQTDSDLGESVGA